jgi:hypothetical protein
MKDSKNLENLQSNLWNASCQMRALGEMLMFQDRDPALDENDVLYGYGSLIREIGERIEAWAKLIDEESVRKASKGRGKRNE